MIHRRVALAGIAAIAAAWFTTGPLPNRRDGTFLSTSAPVLLAAETRCGCPPMPVVATSKDPAKGRAQFETDLGTLEKLFSNRHEMYAGGWDDAMAALAHELDPSGRLKIWDGAAPVPKPNKPALEEGSITGAMLGSITPASALKIEQDVNQITVRLFHTLARINKYGEPQKGLRDAALAILRFSAGHLANISSEASGADPRARILRTVSRTVQGLADGYVAGAIPAGHRDASQIDQRSFGGAEQLVLDVLDLANAALDLYWAPEDRTGDRILRPVEGDEPNVVGLAAVASGWSIFGAKNGGPSQEAVSCRAHSTLVTLVDSRFADARRGRTSLFGKLMKGIFELDSTTTANIAEVRAMRSAALRAGIADDAEADDRVDQLYSFAYGHSTENRPGRIEAASTLRAFTLHAGGDRDTQRGHMAKRIGDNIDETKREVASGNQQPGEVFRTFVDLWEKSSGNVTLADVERPCGPAEGESKANIFLYAITNYGLQQILHPYVGVPMIIEAQYDPPEGDTERVLVVSLGGKERRMTFKRFDPQGYIYRSEPIIPGASQ